jgi:hypothetical protein
MFRITVDNDKRDEKNEIEKHSEDGSTKTVDVTTTYALTEEDTVVVVIVDAHLAVIAMLHVLKDVHVAFDAIHHLIGLAVCILSDFQ